MHKSREFQNSKIKSSGYSSNPIELSKIGEKHSKWESKEKMKEVDTVVKYLKLNQTNWNKNYATSSKLITSDGIPINRGRIRSSTHESVSSNSNSKPRKRFGGHSSSIERKKYLKKENVRIESGSNILIQDFTVSAKQNNQPKNPQSDNEKQLNKVSFASKDNYSSSRKEKSLDILRKSHENQQFSRMYSEEPKKAFQLTSYKDRRNIRLKNKSSHRSEKSSGIILI